MNIYTDSPLTLAASIINKQTSEIIDKKVQHSKKDLYRFHSTYKN